MLLLNYWKTMGNPVVREPALSPRKTHLSEPLPETEPLIRAWEFVDTGIQCDLEFYWSHFLQKSMASVDKTITF